MLSDILDRYFERLHLKLLDSMAYEELKKAQLSDDLIEHILECLENTFIDFSFSDFELIEEYRDECIRRHNLVFRRQNESKQ